MKKILLVILSVVFISGTCFAKKYTPVPPGVKLPAKFTQEYINYISEEYALNKIKDVLTKRIGKHRGYRDNDVNKLEERARLFVKKVAVL